jgi:Na+:H+ antiporter, NhaA family
MKSHRGTQKVQEYIRFLLENSFFLIIGTAAGLIWANVNWPSYERITHQIHFAVNDIGMVFFFGIAAKEVFEALLPGGVLASARKAAMPLLATLGGMIGPASLYVSGALLLGRSDLIRGWAIPCATDIAFSYLVARFVFGAKHPAIPFLLLLAIADDGLGLLILALFYPTGEIHLPLFAGFVAAALGVALILKRLGVTNFWPYLLISGSLSWVGFYQGGFHPALALVPVIFSMPHARTDIGVFAEGEVGADALNQFEHWWSNPVELILGFFGLANAGVMLSSVGTGTWLVLVGLLAGKPLGIITFSFLGRALKLSLPEGMRWADLVVLGFAAAVGFTVALFISTVAFDPGETLDTVKMGSLLSFSAILLTAIAAKLLCIKPVRV